MKISDQKKLLSLERPKFKKDSVADKKKPGALCTPGLW